MTGCLPNPCKNLGQCRNKNDQCSCECITGYSGQFCQNLDICGVKNPCVCGNCINDPTNTYGFRCECPRGKILLFYFNVSAINTGLILRIKDTMVKDAKDNIIV